MTLKCGWCEAPMADEAMLRRHVVDVHVFHGEKGVRDEFMPPEQVCPSRWGTTDWPDAQVVTFASGEATRGGE